MLVTYNNTKAILIGDPHLGKEFTEGVPLHRRGEREKEQLSVFRNALDTTGVDMNVMMGDIFDKFVVSPTVLFSVYEAYAYYADLFPETDFILLRGNHDVSRNSEIKSSFDLLAAMLKPFSNIYVIEELTEFRSRQGDMFLFFPYDAFISSQEMLGAKYPDGSDQQYAAAFGHWDLESFGGTDFNLVPCHSLSFFTKEVVSGHVHTPTVFDRDGVRVTGTGSMQPYSHGEDPDGKIYVTVTVDEAKANVLREPDFYREKCVRLLAKSGEEIPTFECRQIAIKAVAGDTNPEEMTAEMGEFDFEQLFKDAFQGAGLSQDEMQDAWAKYTEVSQGE